MSPILDILSLIVETLSADVEMLSPIGEILWGFFGRYYFFSTILGDTLIMRRIPPYTYTTHMQEPHTHTHTHIQMRTPESGGLAKRESMNI